MKRERSGIPLLLGLLLAFSMLVSITQDTKQPTRSASCTCAQQQGHQVLASKNNTLMGLG